MLRNSFRHRAKHAIEHLAASASLESLARALEAPTDFGAIATALGHGAIPDSALDLDPFADALARGATEKARLAGLAGGLLSATEAGLALGGISRQAVDKRRRAHQLLAVKVASDWRYPAIQIGPEGQPPSYLPPTLAAAAEAGITGWTLLDFLLTPDTALNGASPLQAIQQGEEGAAKVRRLIEAEAVSAFG